MRNTPKDKYDIAIIGAGIGGLICGCYLAKAGLKVLIVEKNAKPGGYCTSFKRKGFIFDACAHSFGSCREGGNIKTMLDELGITDRFNIKRYEPSDIIITPDHKISYYSSLNKTIQEFQKAFPKEAKNINTFFNDVVSYSNVSLLSLRNKTFNKLLDEYFSNNKLKAILSLPLLGNAGLPASLISALLSFLLYREFMIDGGYYPEGGVQVLSDNLAMRFKEFGGNLLLSHLVKEIKIRNDTVKGIVVKKEGFIPARYVVSACDANQTFLEFLKKGRDDDKFEGKLNEMKPSLSMFILYLGVDNNFETIFFEGSNIWYLPHYDVESMYLSAMNRTINNFEEYMVRISPGKRSIIVFVNANFANKNFWDNYKEKISNILIKKVENIFPNLSKHIVYKGISTPHTLYKWTLNSRGAAYGWAAVPSQIMVSGFSQTESSQNLYLTGHWTTLAHGIRGAVFSGSNTAKSILNKNNIIKQ